MAKEALEKVKNAESEAENIISRAESDASELLAKAGEAAQSRLKELETEEARKMRESLAKAEIEAEQEFEGFKAEVSEKCEIRHKEILAGKEEIIGRILGAVKKG